MEDIDKAFTMVDEIKHKTFNKYKFSLVAVLAYFNGNVLALTYPVTFNALVKPSPTARSCSIFL